jgi:TPR repeat protein
MTHRRWFSVRPTLLAALALFLIPCNQSRADFDTGRAAYYRGDYGIAFDEFLPSALQGNARSQIGLGLLLARGQGTKEDIVGSYSWFDLAQGAEYEHWVVRTLARVNRDYLKRQMTQEQVAQATLRSTVLLASPMPLGGPAILESATVQYARDPHSIPGAASPRAGRAPKTTRIQTSGSADIDGSYQIQLAALHSGYRKTLQSMWSQLKHRHTVLKELQPQLVRVDLGNLGVYDALRAGSFADAGSANATCTRLIATNDDCFVVAK